MEEEKKAEEKRRKEEMEQRYFVKTLDGKYSQFNKKVLFSRSYSNLMVEEKMTSNRDNDSDSDDFM